MSLRGFAALDRPCRLLAFDVVFLVQAVATLWIVPAALHVIDGRLPGASFYDLPLVRPPAPVGDIAETLWSMLLEGAIVLVSVIPAAFYSRVRWPVVLVAAVMNRPTILIVLWMLHCGASG